jgi:hypothetical protein
VSEGLSKPVKPKKLKSNVFYSNPWMDGSINLKPKFNSNSDYKIQNNRSGRRHGRSYPGKTNITNVKFLMNFIRVAPRRARTKKYLFEAFVQRKFNHGTRRLFKKLSRTVPNR